jgi:protein O-GlcNAc transferase
MPDYEQAVVKAFEVLLSEEPEGAIRACEEIEKRNPDRAEHLFVLGLTGMILGDTPKAIQLLTKGHERAPHLREFCDALSVLSSRMGNLSDSVYFAKLGIVAESSELLEKMMPAEFREVEDRLLNVGIAQYSVEGWINFHERRYESAVQLAQKQITLDGGDSDTFMLLGRAHGELGNYANAIEAALKSAEKDPDNEDVRIFLADLLEATGRVPEAIDVYRAILQRNPASLAARNQLLSALIQSGTTDWNGIRASLGELCSTVKSAKEARSTLSSVPPRIRVAYLVNEQAISKFSGILGTALADRTETEFRTVVYQQYAQPFAGTDRLRRLADDWRATYNIDDETLALIIANDEIHVLIDMCGFGVGNRQQLLARKVAPVQINWLGLPLAGCPEFADAVVEDAIATSTVELDGVARERMPGSMLAYAGGTVQIELSRDNPSPAAAIGHITFGGLLDPSTLDQMVAAWAEILKGVPSSRLILGGIAGIDTWTQSHAMSLFKEHGVIDRVSVQIPRVAGSARAEFLAAIDILLDSPRAAHVDLVCDALWQGVPVVTQTFEHASSRLGASALAAAGLADWIGGDREGYIAIAKELAADVKQVATLRNTLRERIQQSPLCNTVGFMQRFERTLRDLCARAVAESK